MNTACKQTSSCLLNAGDVDDVADDAMLLAMPGVASLRRHRVLFSFYPHQQQKHRPTILAEAQFVTPVFFVQTGTPEVYLLLAIGQSWVRQAFRGPQNNAGQAPLTDSNSGSSTFCLCWKFVMLQLSTSMTLTSQRAEVCLSVCACCFHPQLPAGAISLGWFSGDPKMCECETPPPKRKTCDEMRQSLRKMGRKTSGVKAELEERLDEVLNTNDKGWARIVGATCECFTYLASGAHRHVYQGFYTKGPRKGQGAVKKEFKTGSVFENSFFNEDIKATRAAQSMIGAFNTLQNRKKVYLNEPKVWKSVQPDSAGRHAKCLVEPLIQGEYHKFNSNTAYIVEDFHTMQALSHFSYHHSGGQRLLCDLQGGYYDDFYVLTDPVICSVEKAFGATDLGLDGIENFFGYHRCNHLCGSHWLKPRQPVRRFQPMAGTTFCR